jgi:hypothetical protein
MLHCMTIRYFLQKTVHEHKATYSDDHAWDFIDVYLKEMKKREKTEKFHPFLVSLDFMYYQLVIYICIHTITLTTGMNKATCSAYLFHKLHSISSLPDE